MAKEGSTIGGLMDSIGTLTSLALQYGVPLEALVKKFAHQRFEPCGFTKNPDIRNASSITDYVFRWLALQFVPGYPRGQLAQPQPAGTGHARPAGGGEKKGEPPGAGTGRSPKTRTLWTSKPGNGNGKGHPPASPPGANEVKTLSDAVAHFQQDAPDLPELRPRRRPQRRLLQVPELRREPGCS